MAIRLQALIYQVNIAVCLVLKETQRKLRRQYGVPFLVTILAFVSLAAALLVRAVTAVSSPADGGRFIFYADLVWFAWVGFGLISGRDFLGHISLSRIRTLPLSFGSVFVVDIVVGIFVSLPVVTFPAVMWFAWKTTGSYYEMVIVATAFWLFVGTVRHAVFILRAVASGRNRVSPRSQCISLAASVLIIGRVLVAFASYSPAAVFVPYRVMALRVDGAFAHLGVLALSYAYLALSEYVIHRDVLWKGYIASYSVKPRFLPSILRFCDTPGSVLWCLAAAGLMRNRNAMLLFLWAILYGFGYVHWAGISDSLELLAFCWMVTIFHSYLRANMFGIDHDGVWAYISPPERMGSAIRAKNAIFSIMQGLMVCAVLTAGWMNHPHFSRPLQAWSLVIAASFSAIAVSEILGTVFSVRFAEPIERTSLYSGAMTIGAFVIPFAQLVVIVLLVAMAGWLTMWLRPWEQVVCLEAAPLGLFALSWSLLPRILGRWMIEGKDTFISELTTRNS